MRARLIEDLSFKRIKDPKASLDLIDSERKKLQEALAIMQDSFKLSKKHDFASIFNSLELIKNMFLSHVVINYLKHKYKYEIERSINPNVFIMRIDENTYIKFQHHYNFIETDFYKDGGLADYKNLRSFDALDIFINICLKNNLKN